MSSINIKRGWRQTKIIFFKHLKTTGLYPFLGIDQYHIFLLPTTIWFETVRNKKLNKGTRLALLQLAITAFVRICAELEKYEKVKAELTKHKRKKENRNVQFTTLKGNVFSKLVQLIRALNTLTTLYVGLSCLPELNFLHLSTMSEEHFNVQIRTICRGDDDVARVAVVVARLNLSVFFMEKYGNSISYAEKRLHWRSYILR